MYREVVELTAYLCRKYALEPLQDGVVLCRAEGYKRGTASNHVVVLHWFPRFGKSMDDFRADVAKEMEEIMDEAKIRAIVREEMAAYFFAQDAKQPTENWQIQGLARAKAAGITDGSRPMSICTRLESAMMAAKAKEG